MTAASPQLALPAAPPSATVSSVTWSMTRGADARMPYAKPEILISTEEVAARLGDPELRLVEVDEDTTAYEKGHIRGAVALNWRDELQSATSRGVVDQRGFEALLGSRGIDEQSDVILYGGN